MVAGSKTVTRFDGTPDPQPEDNTPGRNLVLPRTEGSSQPRSTPEPLVGQPVIARVGLRSAVVLTSALTFPE